MLTCLKRLSRLFTFSDADGSVTITRPVTFARTATLTGAVTLPNDTVTYAKMQNISATDKILGRSTAGAGDIEEISCTAAGRALLDDANATAQIATLGLDADIATLSLPASTTISTAGAELINDANAAAQLITLGITPAAASINLLVQGVAAGYKLARGTVTPTTESDTVVTGLATVVAAIVSFKGAPTLTHMFNVADIGNQSGAPAAGSIYIKSYKPTATNDVTPTAATTPWGAVDWIAIGT